MIRITRSNLNFEREPLATPFGFKGGFLTELWQTIALLTEEGGKRGVGLGVQSVLWSDPRVFAANSEAGGNALMLLLTSYALRHAEGRTFETPLDLLDALVPPTFAYGKTITNTPDLRLTFVLNSLVAVDNAAWRLYAATRGLTDFDALIPDFARPALSYRQSEVLSIPAVGYGLGVEEVVRLAEAGHTLFKIKVGSDPAKDGNLDTMLDGDIARMRALHAALQSYPHVRYYLDANGRYDTKARLLKLLDALDSFGALAQTTLLEEPFPEENLENVADVPVRVVADESAHTDRDVAERIALGYGAIALKPAAKTLSMSFRMAQVAHAAGVPCLCADLTVNPVLVDWNKTFAARLAPLPGLTGGALEANGHQNYRDWPRMQSYHPCASAPWTESQNGVFPLDSDFYATSGGILLPLPHYDSLVP